MEKSAIDEEIALVSTRVPAQFVRTLKKFQGGDADDDGGYDDDADADGSTDRRES